MKRRNEPEKFYYVEVHPVICSPDELDFHLAEFGKAFMDRNHIHRWIHITQEKPEKASDELGKLLWGIDTKFQHVVSGSSAFPDSLERRFGVTRGVYFDGMEEPCKVTAMEASTLAAERSYDALFSIIPGESAIFFFHHGDVIFLEKRN